MLFVPITEYKKIHLFVDTKWEQYHMHSSRLGSLTEQYQVHVPPLLFGKSIKISYTVKSRYLELAYFELPLISKWKSGPCLNINGAWNIGQGHPVKEPAVRTLRRSTMQGLMVVGLTVEEILKVDVKCVKDTGAQNIGQGHRVKIPAKSVNIGEALCKIWWLEVLHLRRSGMLM